jgi:hypothetical protein
MQQFQHTNAVSIIHIIRFKLTILAQMVVSFPRYRWNKLCKYLKIPSRMLLKMWFWQGPYRIRILGYSTPSVGFHFYKVTSQVSLPSQTELISATNLLVRMVVAPLSISWVATTYMAMCLFRTSLAMPNTNGDKGFPTVSALCDQGRRHLVLNRPKCV